MGTSATYITSADITNVHFNQFPSGTRDAYVQEANDYCEDFAMTLGVDVDSIVATTPIMVKRMLSCYCVMRLAEDSIGTNSTTLSQGEDMYVEMRAEYRNLLKDYQSKVTPEVLTGVSYDRSQRSVSTGRYFRG
jgi:hypothetical protein